MPTVDLGQKAFQNSWKHRGKRNDTLPTKIWKERSLQTFNQKKENFVDDSGASMLRAEQKRSDLSRIRIRGSRHPATVITKNGSTEANEWAIVYVEDMDMFVTVQLLEDTPAALSLGKHGCSNEWKGRQTPNLVENDRTLQIRQPRACCCSWFVE